MLHKDCAYYLFFEPESVIPSQPIRTVADLQNALVLFDLAVLGVAGSMVSFVSVEPQARDAAEQDPREDTIVSNTLTEPSPPSPAPATTQPSVVASALLNTQTAHARSPSPENITIDDDVIEALETLFAVDAFPPAPHGPVHSPPTFIMVEETKNDFACVTVPWINSLSKRPRDWIDQIILAGNCNCLGESSTISALYVSEDFCVLTQHPPPSVRTSAPETVQLMQLNGEPLLLPGGDISTHLDASAIREDHVMARVARITARLESSKAPDAEHPGSFIYSNRGVVDLCSQTHRFHVIALPRRLDLFSVRDLTSEHIVLLTAINHEVTTFLSELLNYSRNDIVGFLNYPPSLWHLHIHFVHRNSPILSQTGRALPFGCIMLLTDVISQLQQNTNAFADATLQYPIADQV